MNRRILFLSLWAITGLVACAAESADNSDARLRDALRTATLQLRTAQADLANLQSSQAALADEKKGLADKFEVLRKQAVADRSADEKTLVTLRTQAVALHEGNLRLKGALAKSEVGHRQAETAATEKETERAKLAAQVIVLEQKVADRETKNFALFKIGNEILTRYEKFSLGEALTAREPFVGSTRARLENLVQDYQDKLTQERAKP